MVTMLGWFSAEAAFASRSKRPRRRASDICSAGNILSATRRSSRRSRAEYTTPMPPSPSLSRISKCEMVRPTMPSGIPRLNPILSRIQNGVHRRKRLRHGPLLRIDHNMRIRHGRRRAGRAAVGIRPASRIALGMTRDLHRARLGAIRSEFLTLRARALVELHVPGFLGVAHPQPRDFVPRFHVMLLMFFYNRSRIVDL